MRVVFADADADYWRDSIVKGNWGPLPASPSFDHLKDCDNCQTSLWQFFDIRGRVNYTTEPCFHVAYHSADVPNRCLDKGLGLYSVATMDKTGHEVVIAFCPWCGIGLPTGAS